MAQLLYVRSCPLCGGDVSSERLLAGLPCEKHGDTRIQLYDVEWIFKPFHVKPWSAQRLWARRFLKEESFILTAPTGSGKTLAGMAFALASALNGKKSLIIVPTATLAYQVESRLREVVKESCSHVKIVGLHSLTKKPEKSSVKESQIIISTSMSLIRNSDMVKDVKVNLVFVDDVDGFLRKSKAIDTVLEMLGVTGEILGEAEKLLSLKKVEMERDEFSHQISKLREWFKGKQVIISGATQTAKRTKRVRLLNLLLGFDVSTKVLGVRNILDVYVMAEGNLYTQIINLVKLLGHGGLIYIHGVENAVSLAEALSKAGIKAEAYIKASKKLFNMFMVSELHILVGTATSRSSLVRGVDLPEAARYAIFVGVPRYTVKLTWDEITPMRALVAITHVLKFAKETEEKIRGGKLIDNLRKISNLTTFDIEKIRKGEVAGNRFLEYAKGVLEESLSFLKEVVKKPEVYEGSSLTEDGLVFPDAITYVQASGRTSRLTAGGMTQGLSILIVDDVKAFKLLKENLEALDINFKPLSEVRLESVLEEIDKTRKLKVGVDVEAKAKSRLVVVESPTKARTITSFFGKPVRRIVNNVPTFEVISPLGLMVIMPTKGHFYDLDIDRENFGAKLYNGNFLVYFKPTRLEVVEALRKLAQDVDEVFVATDPDAEGEKIAWDVKALASPFNLNIKRIRYHEVTKRAINEALTNPENFDENLLHAQLLRRVEDAWIGLPLSMIIQKSFGYRRLSAGRVQTPVLGWVVERTELNAKEKVELISLTLENGFQLTFKAPKGTFSKIKEKGVVEVTNAWREVREVFPPPPYITSTLLIDAGKQLKMGTDESMRIAQELFESGLITYHRTDSTMVSGFGIELAKRYLSKMNLEGYFEPRSWGGGAGAHECIRPTRPLNAEEVEVMIKSRLLPSPIPLGRRHFSLYNLIFKRFVASQMKPAKIEYLNLKVNAGGFIIENLSFPVKILEPGFITVMHLEVVKVFPDKGIYKVVEGKRKLIGVEPLYNEADLIRLMKEKGIGRPSTYAVIIEKLKDRYYVTKLKGGQLVATKLGKMAYEFLISQYRDLLSEERTRMLYADMDAVERGEVRLVGAIKKLHEEVSCLLSLR
ncbi:MAG: reverse gyrase [Candidatus Bathyarchaeota archaeon]